MNDCITTYLGTIDYRVAWDLQRSLASKHLFNVLLLLQHPHTITLGRRALEEDILVSKNYLMTKKIELVSIDRGGEVTYHGPGQLVGYPIVDLRSLNKGPLQYIRALEEMLKACLLEFGIQGRCIKGKTGVWVRDKKIGAIGIKVSRGITMHGFAINVTTDLTYFDYIVPCGMKNCRTTSMESILGYKIKMEDVKQSIISNFQRVLNIKCVPVEKSLLYASLSDSPADSPLTDLTLKGTRLATYE